ncbi:hypothetical protein ACWGI0_06160 [Streptomyces sp. NPDC054802]
MDLNAVADELYGLRPEEFTAARNSHAATARKAGERELAKQIKKLRRPALAAWAANLLVREQPGQVQPLIQLGQGLRQAHQDFDGEQLRELTAQQHALISALSRQARRLAAEAGHRLSEDAQHEVEETLHAVLADPQAAREWAAGRLTKPLSATTGFTAAARGGATQPAAAPRAAPKRPAPRGDTEQAQERGRRRVAQARQDAEDAERELRERQEESAAAARAAEDATKLTQTLQQRVTGLKEELKKTEEEQRQARSAERAARGRVRDADREVRQARRRAQAAAARLERLTAGSG